MSGRNKNNITLTQHGVVTQEAMLAYLAGMLSVEDTARFEKLVAEDPFAHEALEGLQSIQSANGLKQTLNDLNSRIQEQSGGKVVPMPASGSVLRYSVAAAVIGVLIGFGFLLTQYFSNQTNSLAENAQKTEEPVQEQTILPPADEQIVPAIDTTAVADTSATIVDTNAANSSLQSKWAEAETSPAVQSGTYKDAAPVRAESATDRKKIAETKEQKNTVGKKQEEVSKRPVPLATPSPVAAKAASPAAGVAKGNETMAAADAVISEESNDDKDASIETAMNSFNTKKYDEAAKQFHKLLKKQPDNPDVLYFGGVSEYINGNSNKALNNFDKLLSSGNKYTDGAKWYKSQILLQKGKKEQAKQLMKELSNTNSIYRERSVLKLEELNK
jgi:TolA-binding protein